MLPRKKILLHIGLGKTGTTYLQSIFSKNKKLLLHNDIDYPCEDSLKSIENGFPNGNIIKIAFKYGHISYEKNRPAFRLTNKFSKLLHQIANNSKKSIILFSGEHLSFQKKMRLSI